MLTYNNGCLIQTFEWISSVEIYDNCVNHKKNKLSELSIILISTGPGWSWVSLFTMNLNIGHIQIDQKEDHDNIDTNINYLELICGFTWASSYNLSHRFSWCFFLLPRWTPRQAFQQTPVTTDNLRQSSRDAAFGIFSLPSLRSLTLIGTSRLDESFYTGVADAASLSKVGDGTWQIEMWAKPWTLIVPSQLHIIETFSHATFEFIYEKFWNCALKDKLCIIHILPVIIIM